MNRDEEQSRDPQSTLPPRQSGKLNAGGTQGRRLILGTPRVTSSVGVPQADTDVNRGFTLGKKPDVAAPSKPKPVVQPWILMLAGGALLLLVVALIVRPGGVSNAEGAANERLLAQYTKYLETKGETKGPAVAERRKEVISRLQAVSWAKAVGDTAKLESELTALLFLDNDKGSPLYQYSVKQLKELPSKRRAGL